jgi:hypothetical protein
VLLGKGQRVPVLKSASWPCSLGWKGKAERTVHWFVTREKHYSLAENKTSDIKPAWCSISYVHECEHVSGDCPAGKKVVILLTGSHAVINM